MSNYKDLIPTGKAVSKAQWHFFKRCPEECPAEQTERRAALIHALHVDYASLPAKAGSGSKAKASTAAKPKPQVQAPSPGLRPSSQGVR